MVQSSCALGQLTRTGFLAASILGFAGAAFAADDCASAPKNRPADARHWHYYVDRVHHRKCWFADKPEIIPSAKEEAATEIGTAPVEKQSSWPFPLSLLLPEPAKPPQETAVGEPSTNSTPQGEPAAVPNRGDTSQKQQSIAPAPRPKRVAAHKAEKRSVALRPAAHDSNSLFDPAKRNALFQAYLQWRDQQTRRERR
jgi:hypothetical protein